MIDPRTIPLFPEVIDGRVRALAEAAEKWESEVDADPDFKAAWEFLRPLCSIIEFEAIRSRYLRDAWDRAEARPEAATEILWELLEAELTMRLSDHEVS